MKNNCCNCGKSIETKEDEMAYFDTDMCAPCAKSFNQMMEEAKEAEEETYAF